jgi:hypothetical protein
MPTYREATNFYRKTTIVVDIRSINKRGVIQEAVKFWRTRYIGEYFDIRAVNTKDERDTAYACRSERIR